MPEDQNQHGESQSLSQERSGEPLPRPDTGGTQPPGPPKSPSTVAAATPDPFDPKRYRISPQNSLGQGVQKVITTVSCRKPNKQEFFRIRRGIDWQYETAVLEESASREIFLVDPAVLGELTTEVSFVTLFVAINRSNDVFLTSAKMPHVEGRTNSWTESYLAAMKLAEEKWVRIAANMAMGAYDVWQAQGQIPEPTWPELKLDQLIERCFRGRVIDSPSHPILRKLRGEL